MHLCGRVYGAKGLVLHSVNGQLCAGKLYADQIGLIRASGRPLTIDCRAPLPNEKYFVPKRTSQGEPDSAAGDTKKVQRPIPQKAPATEDRSPASPAPLSLMPSSSTSSTSDSPSWFKQPRPSGLNPQEGVPPPRGQATTPSVQTSTGPVSRSSQFLQQAASLCKCYSSLSSFLGCFRASARAACAGGGLGRAQSD